MELIEQQAEHDNTNMYEIIKQYEIGKGKAKANIQAFVALIEECRQLVNEISIDQLLEKVLEDSGYLDMLREDKEIERLENIKELLAISPTMWKITRRDPYKNIYRRFLYIPIKRQIAVVILYS